MTFIERSEVRKKDDQSLRSLDGTGGGGSTMRPGCLREHAGILLRPACNGRRAFCEIDFLVKRNPEAVVLDPSHTSENNSDVAQFEFDTGAGVSLSNCLRPSSRHPRGCAPRHTNGLSGDCSSPGCQPTKKQTVSGETPWFSTPVIFRFASLTRRSPQVLRNIPIMTSLRRYHHALIGTRLTGW